MGQVWGETASCRKWCEGVAAPIGGRRSPHSRPISILLYFEVYYRIAWEEVSTRYQSGPRKERMPGKSKATYSMYALFPRFPTTGQIGTVILIFWSRQQCLGRKSASLQAHAAAANRLTPSNLPGQGSFILSTCLALQKEAA